jgi:hypothetical protein
MKTTFIILTILLTGFTEGYSCKCYQMNLKNEIDSADLIFLGIPIEKKQIESKMIYKFSVVKIWKGERTDTIEIQTGLGGQDCGMIFELGKNYIVYSRNGQTTDCQRNSLANMTFDELKLDYIFMPECALISFTGIDQQLSDKEGEYLNRQFKDLSDEFDFKNKSILFTSNRTVINKRDWFQRFWVYDKPVVQLVKLTDQEKLETGYDAILVTYCKIMITDKTKKKILKQIQK